MRWLVHRVPFRDGDRCRQHGQRRWLLAGDERRQGLSLGNAAWHGDALAIGRPATPRRAHGGFAVASNETGYYLLDGEGHVYAFGTAPYGGSASGYAGNPVGIVTNPAGAGYWVVTSYGTIQSFGGAAHFSSVPGVSGVVSAAATADGKGLWLLSSNGAIHTVGTAVSYGIPRGPLASPMVSIATASGGKGYWMTESNGTVDAFSLPAGLRNYGSEIGRSERIVAITAP